MRWIGSVGALLLAVAPPGALLAQASEAAESAAVKERVRGLDSVVRVALDGSRFEEALRAVDEAYRLTNDPKYLFNQGFIADKAYWSNENEADLVRAVDSLRAYLKAAPQGKKRGEAAQKLKRLEPLLPAPAPIDPEAPPPTPPPTPAPSTPRTGVMITSSTPGAVIELDGKLRANGFLVADVEPGPHRVRVLADGYVPIERDVPVQPGALVGVDVPLEPKPALLDIKGPSGARLAVDGEPRGELPLAKPLALPPGDRLITVQMAGARSKTEWKSLERGTSYSFDAELDTTAQRHVAWATFIVSGAAGVAGAVLAGLAVQRQADAAELLAPVTEETGSIQEKDLTDFDAALKDRDNYRVGAGVAWGVAGAGLVAGIFLYVFDDPAVQTAPPPPGKRGVGPGLEEPDPVELSVSPLLGPSFAGLAVGGRF
jgi:hypothetical protein